MYNLYVCFFSRSNARYHSPAFCLHGFADCEMQYSSLTRHSCLTVRTLRFTGPPSCLLLLNLTFPSECSGWNSDPFVLTPDQETGRLYGRGSSDDKGPLLGWINVVEAHVKTGIPLPVNLRFCFEGMVLSPCLCCGVSDDFYFRYRHGRERVGRAR